MKKKNTAIYIIGAGAIGKALAVFLKKEGKDVVLLRGHVHDVAGHLEHIEVESGSGEIISAEVFVSSIDNYAAIDGIVVVTTKSYGNPQIAAGLAGKTGRSPIVILQNGLDVETPFVNDTFSGVYRCVLFTSSQYAEANRLRFRPAAASPIGIIRGNSQTLGLIIEALRNPYLVFAAEENIQPIIWTKAIINSVFNSVCPLLETDNGIFHRNEKALNMAREIIGECVSVAAAAGVDLDADKVLERLLLISRTSDGQLISTYQDILHKRRTEIETLNTTIARIADRLGKNAMVKGTRVLGELIQIKSEIAMRS